MSSFVSPPPRAWSSSPARHEPPADSWERGQDRWVGGVGSMLSRRTGMPVGLVRFLLFVSTWLGGVGFLAYGMLWVLTPNSPGVIPRVREKFLAAFLALTCASMGVRALGPGENYGDVVALTLILVGVSLAWNRLPGVSRLVRDVPWMKAMQPRRVALAVGLVVLGIGSLIVSRVPSNQLVGTLFAALAVLVGVAIVIFPWGMKLWRDFLDERSALVRETERAQVAAHLHDSVLQTLALIQKRAASPDTVAALARAQERELREWLYGSGSARDEPTTVAAELKRAAGEVEDAYQRRIQTVTVGDRPSDDRVQALVRAAREAMVNAVKHTAGPVSVYGEFNSAGAQVFVKDGGPGFDLDAVAADRKGLRESIVARMERHGGAAQVVSGPGGTEVRLSLPPE